jgi:hypothetical protein
LEQLGTPEIVSTQVIETKAAIKVYRNKKCAECGIEFTPLSGPQKFCEEHRVHADNDEERKQNTLERTNKFRAKERGKQEKKNAKFNSDYIPSKGEAKEILSIRIINQHVIDTCYDLGILAAERLHIPANIFFWTNGAQETLASLEQKKEQLLDIQHDEEIDGEVVHRGDLYALWDYSISWRDQTSFEVFLVLRNLCKTNAFQLGLILGKDFHDQPHLNWRDFFPKFTPTLRPGYTQEGMKEWLASQDPVKDRLLMASRNAYKSSWNIVWLLTAVLSCPDIRLLLVSETTKLSKGFIRGFRSYFEIVNKREPTRFQQLFPEHMIPPGDGSTLSFESPMRTLNLIQFTAEATSMESTVAGQRADILVFDDPISDRNTGNEEQRQKGVDIFDATQKLREVGGYTILIGTPWHVEDLYATLIRRTTADEQTDELERMQIRIDPAWTVKPEARNKPLRQLEEKDVELLFPSRLTWKFLQKELRANESFFRSQNLCEFVSEDDQLKVTFVEEDLRSRVRVSTYFERSFTNHIVLAVDPSFSQARFADFSALAILEIIQHEDRTICFVKDVQLERMKQSELGQRIVDTIARFQVTRVVIEKTGPWMDLQNHIQHSAALRQVMLPHIFWKDTKGNNLTPNIKVKASRIKGLEVLLAENRLYFAAGMWNDIVINQFVKFDGVSRSNNTRKDDAPDAIAMGCEIFMPRFHDQTTATSALQREAEEQARIQEHIRGIYNQVFGNQQLPGNFQSRYATPPPDSPGPFERGGMNRFGFTRKAA